MLARKPILALLLPGQKVARPLPRAHGDIQRPTFLAASAGLAGVRAVGVVQGPAFGMAVEREWA